MLDRGFTGHEHLSFFGLINMNARLYDPVLGRFLSPDPYVQVLDFTQSYNRYMYAMNNPLCYVDRNGEFLWFVPVIIGAAIGMYSGGVIANKGQYNPVKWDWSSGKTWGYMLGGAVVGGVSGYVGGAIATSGIPMANTVAIAGSSLVNSVGTWAYTGGQTPISISLGAVSYDFTNGDFGSFGTVFLLHVICTESSTFSASFPVRSYFLRSTNIKWLSVPPDTMSNPSSISAFARVSAFFTDRKSVV